MSYARFGADGSDVYVFFSVDHMLECCGCRLQKWMWVDGDELTPGSRLEPVGEIVPDTFGSTAEMEAHLQRHIAEGHHVPDYVIPDLWADDATNFPGGDP